MILGPWGTPGDVILEALELFWGALGHLGHPRFHPDEKYPIWRPLGARKTYPKINEVLKNLEFWGMFFDIFFRFVFSLIFGGSRSRFWRPQTLKKYVFYMRAAAFFSYFEEIRSHIDFGGPQGSIFGRFWMPHVP